LARTLVIIPARDEAATLGQVLAGLGRSLPGADVLVVDDGSVDATVEVARRGGARVLSQPRCLGYGRALIDGFALAASRGYARAATLDADLQHDPAWLPALLEALEDADVASGSRYLPASPRLTPAPAERGAINRQVTSWVRQITGYAISDAFCGCKAYRVEALARLRLSEEGYAFPCQFWVQAAAAGLRVVEVPVGLVYFAEAGRDFPAPLRDPAVRLETYRRVLLEEARRCGLACRAS
jgi:dolichol-phosphate mannosyltransferase